MSKTVAIFVEKEGLIWLNSGFLIQLFRTQCNRFLKIVYHWDKSDDGVMCTGKEIKSGLNLIRMETDVATHIHTNASFFFEKKT